MYCPWSFYCSGSLHRITQGSVLIIELYWVPSSVMKWPVLSFSKLAQVFSNNREDLSSRIVGGNQTGSCLNVRIRTNCWFSLVRSGDESGATGFLRSRSRSTSWSSMKTPVEGSVEYKVPSWFTTGWIGNLVSGWVGGGFPSNQSLEECTGRLCCWPSLRSSLIRVKRLILIVNLLSEPFYHQYNVQCCPCSNKVPSKYHHFLINFLREQ